MFFSRSSLLQTSYLLLLCNDAIVNAKPQPILPRASAVVAPSCTSTPKATPPAGFICNSQGALTKPAYIANYTALTVNACADKCLSNTACISFSHGPRNACSTYSTKIVKSNFKKSNSGKTFWNRNCFTRTCKAPAPAPATCSQPTPDTCGKNCTNVQNDNSNCGTCGTTCATSQGIACSSGSCQQVCDPGAMYCPGPPGFADYCTAGPNDDNNCGSCGNACGASQSCSSGTCVCSSGTLNDDSNCGTCGNICYSGETCIGGSCACSSGTLNDNDNCGSCDNPCDTDESCSNGSCVCSNGTLNDDNNCGSCGAACTNGQSCNPIGQCQCSSGSLNDNNNCGSCGNVCSTSSVCKNAQCVLTFSLQVAGSGIPTVDGTNVVTNYGAALYVGNSGTSGYQSFYVDSNSILRVYDASFPVVGYVDLSGSGYVSVIAFNSNPPSYLTCDTPTLGQDLTCNLNIGGSQYSQFAVDAQKTVTRNTDGAKLGGYFMFAADGTQNKTTFPTAHLVVGAPLPPLENYDYY